jgi:lipoate---protein ligase
VNHLSHRPALNLLCLESFPILQQLQLEEALLRADSGNWCLINEGTSPSAIVMGISGKIDQHIHQAKWNSKPIQIIKRFSGGGTVVVDKDTFFVTFICNNNDLNVASYPDKVFKWTETFYQNVFPDLPFRLFENDYVFDNKKFGGNAQYMTKHRWLHHSSLLWDFDAENMEYLLMPSKMPSYREQRAHGDFLCSLKQYLPNRQMLKERILIELGEKFSVQTPSRSEAFQVLLRQHRKATVIINKTDFANTLSKKGC